MSERQWNVNRRGRFRFKTRTNLMVVFPSIIWICWIKTSRLACNSKIWKDTIQREECNNNLELAGSRFFSSFSKLRKLRKFCEFFFVGLARLSFFPCVSKFKKFRMFCKINFFNWGKKEFLRRHYLFVRIFHQSFHVYYFSHKENFFFTRKTEVSFILKISFYSNRILRQFSCYFLVTKNFEVKIVSFSYINWTRVSSY